MPDFAHDVTGVTGWIQTCNTMKASAGAASRQVLQVLQVSRAHMCAYFTVVFFRAYIAAIK